MTPTAPDLYWLILCGTARVRGPWPDARAAAAEAGVWDFLVRGELPAGGPTRAGLRRALASGRLRPVDLRDEP